MNCLAMFDADNCFVQDHSLKHSPVVLTFLGNLRHGLSLLEREGTTGAITNHNSDAADNASCLTPITKFWHLRLRS